MKTDNGDFIPNIVTWSNTFKKLYKLKKKTPQYIQDEIKNAVRNLRNSNEPESLGEKKTGPLSGCRSYELNYDNRILYSIYRDRDQIEIKLHKVCNHKQVYG